MIAIFSLFVVLPMILILIAKKEKKDEINSTPILSLPMGAKADIENGKLPTFFCRNLFLSQDEVCHFIENARYDTFSVQKHYVRYGGGSSTAKNNKRYRSSCYSYHPYTTQIKTRHTGTIYITNKRIVFTSNNYGVTISLTDIIIAMPSDKIISFHCTESIYQFYVPDSFLILTLLNNINQKMNCIER